MKNVWNIDILVFESFELLFRCQCLADITSCIMPEESEKSEQDSPLKEPLKKKGNDIHNPYPNFKVSKICDISYMTHIIWVTPFESKICKPCFRFSVKMMLWACSLIGRHYLSLDLIGYEIEILLASIWKPTFNRTKIL